MDNGFDDWEYFDWLGYDEFRETLLCGQSSRPEPGRVRNPEADAADAAQVGGKPTTSLTTPTEEPT